MGCERKLTISPPLSFFVSISYLTQNDWLLNGSDESVTISVKVGKVQKLTLTPSLWPLFGPNCKAIISLCLYKSTNFATEMRCLIYQIVCVGQVMLCDVCKAHR